MLLLLVYHISYEDVVKDVVTVFYETEKSKKKKNELILILYVKFKIVL